MIDETKNSAPTSNGTPEVKPREGIVRAMRLKKSKKGKAAKPDLSKRGGRPRPFPAETLEEALRVATVLKQFNAGNPWSPTEVANALGISARGNKVWYLTASARDYGLTTGTRDTDSIELAPIGRDLVYAANPDSEREAAWRAFFNVDAFKLVHEYYKGGPLPDLKYLQNTLEATFNIPPEYHEDFIRIFADNLHFAERYGARLASAPEEGESASHSIVVGEPRARTDQVAFVVMPFVEKTNAYPEGFFDEVLRNLITPAAVAAGFRSRRQNVKAAMSSNPQL